MQDSTASEADKRCYRKRWISLLFLVSGICLYAFSPARFHSPVTMMPQYRYATTQSDVKVVKDDNSDNAVGLEWSPVMDILDEETALKDPPLTDLRAGIHVENSKVYLIGHKGPFEVGDTAKVRVDLFDGYGKRRTRGGDQLRVRIFEDSLGASAAGYVMDHRNGSFTAVLRCLWAGTPTILVYVSYSREAVRALYHVRRTLSSTRPINVVYQDGSSKTCHAFKTRLGQSAKTCNLTSFNGNMTWFCEAPGRSASCTFKYFEGKRPLPQLPVTAAEEALFKRNGEHLVPVVNIVVNEKASKPQRSFAKPPCRIYNRTSLWFMPSPVGHFMNNIWKTEHCKMTPVDNFPACLRNKHVLLYGDSTIRQWFQAMSQRYKCRLKTEAWHQEKWKKDSAAFCPSLNLTLEWIVHALPGNVDKTRVQINSIAGNMLEFANKKHVIFVIHMLCHVSAYHHNVFKDRIIHISQSVRAILKINKDAKILIKGGHTFRDFRQVSDYYGYVYRKLTIEAFEGLYDKVVYLDNKDMTIAREVIPNHPDESVVSEMVNQMLSYVC